jgi:adenylate cyclase
MDRVNEFNEREGLPRLEMGVAINTGDVVVGNIGSEERAKYGVVGSPVNLTARIESYSIGGQILASHNTISRAGDCVRVGSVIEVNAKGLKEPMKAWDVRGISGEWNLALPERKENFVELASPLSARFAVLEEKHVGEMECIGQFGAVSMTGGVLSTSESLRPMMNLKMRIVGSSGTEIAADLYAKVIAIDDRGAILGFTSIPPEVGNCVKGVLEHLPPPSA